MKQSHVTAFFNFSNVIIKSLETSFTVSDSFSGNNNLRLKVEHKLALCLSSVSKII